MEWSRFENYNKLLDSQTRSDRLSGQKITRTKEVFHVSSFVIWDRYMEYKNSKRNVWRMREREKQETKGMFYVINTLNYVKENQRFIGRLGDWFYSFIICTFQTVTWVSWLEQKTKWNNEISIETQITYHKHHKGYANPIWVFNIFFSAFWKCCTKYLFENDLCQQLRFWIFGFKEIYVFIWHLHGNLRWFGTSKHT